MSLPILQEKGGAFSGLLQGINQGTQAAMPTIGEMILNKQKQKQIMEAFPNLFGVPSKEIQPPQKLDYQKLSIPEQENIGELFGNLALQLEQQTGQELNPQDLDSIWSQLQLNSQQPQQQQIQPQQMQQMGQAQPQYTMQDATKAMLMGRPDLAQMIMKGVELQENLKKEERERSFLPQKEYIEHAAKRNSSFLDRVDQISKDLPSTEFSLAMIEDSLQDAGKWAAFKDTLAEKTGFEGFRSAAGAELDSAIKNYFLGDLSTIKGGRVNQFLEKQLRDAYPKAGRDPISNQKIVVGMKMKENLSRHLVEKTAELEQKYIKDVGHLPSDFQRIVNQEIKSYADEVEKKAIQQMHNLSKIEAQRDKLFRSHVKSGEVLMMSPEGEPFAVPKKEVDSYREQGFIFGGKK